LIEIAGDITLSDNPGATMKKWRNIFSISQSELSKYLKISPSTISDYEAGRRQSPGIAVIQRFVNALVSIDSKKGGHIVKKLTEQMNQMSDFFELHEFVNGVTISEFAKLIGGTVVTCKDSVEKKKIYGYTLINSLKVILDLPYDKFQLMYGKVSERAFIFTSVSTGRSPLVVIRIAPTHPSVIVLHGLKKESLDRLAIKISEREDIPIILTSKPINEIKSELNSI
jgi:putative transcriptional regulator